jgi:hypothetical protein
MRFFSHQNRKSPRAFSKKKMRNPVSASFAMARDKTRRGSCARAIPDGAVVFAAWGFHLVHEVFYPEKTKRAAIGIDAPHEGRVRAARGT